MIGTIYIDGVIGSYQDKNGDLVKGVELIDIIEQYQKSKSNEVINVRISSPGGFVDVGNDIYDYLESLKARHTINTVSSGNVGSIATKIFLVGEKRTMGSTHEFFIHNPWIDGATGDSDAISLVAEALKNEEIKLRKFYTNKTDITDEGLAPLMEKETSLTSEQALKFGFATDIYEPIKALALTRNNMKSESKLDKLIDLIRSAVLPNPKALLLDLEGGDQIFVLTEDDVLEGKSVVIAEDGEATETPAPDGAYNLADSRVINVEGGVIVSIGEQQEAPEENGEVLEKILELLTTNADQSKKLNEKVDEVQNSYSELVSKVEGIEQHNEQKVTEQIEKLALDIKGQINTGHVPPAAGEFSQVKGERRSSYAQSKIDAANKKLQANKS